MPTCEKHYNPDYAVSCMWMSEPHCCDCDHPVMEVEVPTLKYIDKAGEIHPLESVAQISSQCVQGSDRWNDAAEAHFRAKWMPSSDAIRFLDEWKHGRTEELCVHGRRKHVCTVEDPDYKCIACH